VAGCSILGTLRAVPGLSGAIGESKAEGHGSAATGELPEGCKPLVAIRKDLAHAAPSVLDVGSTALASYGEESSRS
jgi:hypothetical protein